MRHRDTGHGQAHAANDFSIAYEEHLAPILRYLQRRLGATAAEDAAADVFLRALRASDDAHPTDTTALPWLYGIAANVIAEHRRAEKRRLRAMQRIATERRARPAELPHGIDLDSDLTRALLRLKPADRETLLLIAWADLSYEQTAEALGIPIGTVRSRMSRVRRQLKTIVAKRPALPDSAPITRSANV